MARLWHLLMRPRIRSSPEFGPTTMRVTPNSGSDVGGEIVHIYGARFIGTTQVELGATPAPWFSVDSDDHIIALTPSHAGGVVSVKVTTRAGNSSLANAYTYVSSGAVPTVIGISPAYGPAAGGTLVTIQVNDSTGCTGATVGGVALVGFSIVDATHVQGTTGAHAAGNVDVTVTNATGTSAPLVGAFRYIAAPVITSLNYDQGQIEGGGAAIIAFGSDLSDGLGVAPQVTIGGNTVAATGWGPGFVAFNLPAHAAGAVTVSVAHAGGTSGTLAFEYWTPASIGASRKLHLRANSNTGYAKSGVNSTWLDTAGGFDFVDAASLGPAIGAAVQSHVPPDGDGAVAGTRLTNSAPLSTFIQATKWLAWALLKADSFTGAAVDFNGPAMINDIAGFFALGISSSGAYAYHWDSSAKSAVKAGLVTGTWYLIIGWIDCSGGPSPVHIEANGAAGTDSANANANTGGGATMMAFKNYQPGQTGHDGPCLEIGILNDPGAASIRTKLLKYCRQRYGLALT